MTYDMTNIYQRAGELAVPPEQTARSAGLENVARSRIEATNDLDMVFCLLYVSDNKEKYINMRFGGIESYLYCASYLGRSLERIGLKLTILTNDKEFILRRCPPLRFARVAQLDFGLDVPNDIAFQSAHHKIEIINYIANTYVEGRYLILDVDVVCVNGALRHLVKKGTSTSVASALDISDHVYCAYGREEVQSGLRLLSKGQLATWFGGEFLLGTPSFFRRLSEEIISIWPDYVAHCHALHHQGDEAVVSAALCRMLEKNERITCVPQGQLIVRWWNTITVHRQIGLFSALRSGLMHLPSDKNFITFCAKANISPSFFPIMYFVYAAMLMPTHFIRASINWFRNKKATNAPRLF